MFGTIPEAPRKHLYVAIWFYIATFVTVAVGNSILSTLSNCLISFLKVIPGMPGYRMRWFNGGMVQCRGLLPDHAISRADVLFHAPKRLTRPVYCTDCRSFTSGRLIFLYIWAGRTTLLYTPRLCPTGLSHGVVFFFHADLPQLGRYDQWSADTFAAGFVMMTTLSLNSWWLLPLYGKGFEGPDAFA